MEINNEYMLFNDKCHDISDHILEFVQDPWQLIRISMVNKSAYELVQSRCKQMIMKAEIMPNSPFGEFTFLRSPLWIYVHLVHPIMIARKKYLVTHPPRVDKSTSMINYLTDSKLISHFYKNLSPLEAVIKYGCPILFENLLRERFSNQPEENSKIKESHEKDQNDSNTPQNDSDNLMRESVRNYEVSLSKNQEFSIVRMIARSKNVNILSHWLSLFPTTPYSPLGHTEPVFKIIAMHGTCEMMEYLLSLSDDSILMDDCSSQFTIVHYAAQANRVDMLEFFCQRQFYLESTTECGKTPLYAACQFDSFEAIQYLMRMKVDPNKTIRTDQPTSFKNTRITPLSRLLFNQHPCDQKSKRALIVEMILLGSVLDTISLMMLFDETFTIQGYVINSLFVSSNIELFNARRFLISLMSSLENKSLTIKEAVALSILCKQFLHDYHEFPMKTTLYDKVTHSLVEVEAYISQKYYHTNDLKDCDDVLPVFVM